MGGKGLKLIPMLVRHLLGPLDLSGPTAIHDYRYIKNAHCLKYIMSKKMLKWSKNEIDPIR